MPDDIVHSGLHARRALRCRINECLDSAGLLWLRYDSDRVQ
jgi:hypothetical protein